MVKPRILLKVRKAITGKKATPKELGYERDSRGRLTKPGTEKFNQKVSLIKGEKELKIKELKKEIKEDLSLKEQKRKEKKLINKKLAYDKKIEYLKLKRKYSLKGKENKRINEIKKRQTKEWVNKLNTLLSVSNKRYTVQSINEELIKKVYEKLERKARKEQKDKLIVWVPTQLEVSKKVTNAFYSEIHRSVIPTELKNMSPTQAIEFLQAIYKKVGRRLTK